MRPHLVVVLPPRLDHNLRLGPGAEPFEAQAFVAELAVEALRGPILPGLARIDQRGLDTLVDDPLQQRSGDELRPIVRTQIERRAARRDEPRKYLDDARRADAATRWPFVLLGRELIKVEALAIELPAPVVGSVP